MKKSLETSRDKAFQAVYQKHILSASSSEILLKTHLAQV